MMTEEGLAPGGAGGREHSTCVAVRRASLDPLPVVLRVESAPARPSTFRLTSGSCILGASNSADVVIEANTVSRRHVELRLTPEGVAVTDLGSRNGTFYLGQRFQHMNLQAGSRF